MKRMIFAVAVLGVFLFAQVAQADWMPVKRLIWSLNDTYEPRVFVDNSGKVHLVWYEEDPGDGGIPEIRYRKSADGGASWIINKLITFTSSRSITPDIAVDSSYKVHVVFMDDKLYGSHVYYKKSTNGGLTWSYWKKLSWNTTNYCNPRIAIDSSDNLHLVWADDAPGEKIYYRKSTDAGATWTVLKTVAWTLGGTVVPALYVDSSNKVHVFWNDDTSGNNEIYYRRSEDGGETWNAAKRLTWTAGASEMPAVACDSLGNLHLMWADYTPGDYEIYYLKSTDGGGSWSAIKRLTWTVGESEFPAIIVDSSNQIHAICDDNVSGNREIYYLKSTDGGSNWTTAQRLNYSAGNSWRSDITSDSSGNLYVFWQDNTSGNYQIYFKKYIK